MKSPKTLFLPLISLLLILFPAPLKSQDKQFELIKGVPHSELLKAGDKHSYTVKLDADRFAYFVLLQDGVDALITIYDPDGKKIQSIDSPNGRKGPEPVSLFSDKKGNYVLEVTALEEKGHQGKYKIIWVKLEPKGTTPEKQIDQLFTHGIVLNRPGLQLPLKKKVK